jgi:hypothetical protein
MAKSGRCLTALAVCGLLAACGGSDEAAVGGVSAEEAAQLNNAAEMLDTSPDSMVAPEDMPLETESGEAPADANRAP